MRCAILFLFQFLLLALHKLCSRKFLQLEAHEVLILLILGNAVFQFSKSLLCSMKLVESLRVCLAFFCVAGYDIYGVQLEVFLLQQKILML